MSNNDLVEICVETKRETEKAYLVSDGIRDYWVPKSQIKAMDMRNGKPIMISLPEWLATEKGVV